MRYQSVGDAVQVFQKEKNKRSKTIKRGRPEAE